MCSLQTGVYRSFYTHVFRGNSSSLGSEQGSQDGRARRKPLTATRQKFMQNSPTTAETSPAQPVRSKMAEASEDTAPKKIARGRTDFNQLLQKFSGSESNSEKSDTDTAAGGPSVGGVPRRRSLVKRQEAKEVVSSSEEADMRKTPERSQSLKVRSRRDDTQSAGSSECAAVSPVVQPAVTSSVEKNSNFRSQFMNKTWAHRNAEVSQPLKDTSPPSSGAFSSSLSEEQTMQTLGVGLSSTTSRKHDFGTSVPSTKQSLGTSVPSMKQSLGTFSVTSERQASRQGHTTSASAAKQEHAANISITKNEVAAKTLDGKEEHVRFISSDKQDIAKSISGDKQYIAKSISSDKQDIAKSILSNKQDIAKSISSDKQDVAKSILSDKQDIAKSISSDKQDIAKSISSDKQDIAKSVNSIKQETSKSIASAKPEQMSSVRMDRSEKMSYVTMERPEQVSSIMRDRLEQVSSVMKDRPEQASSITKDRPEQASSITKDRPEQVSSITKDRPEQVSSITKDRPEQVSSITNDRPEQVSSITKDSPEQVSSITKDRPEQMSSVTREKREQVSSVIREKPEQVSSVTREKPEQVSSVIREKPEQVSSFTREKPEQVSPVIREKPEQVSSATREKPEQVSSATREKPEQVSSATREKPEQVSSVSASERKHVYSFSDSKEHVTPESTGKQDHMTANKHPHLESEVANEQNKRAPSTGRSEEMKMPCKSDNTSPAPSAETQPKDADVPVPSMARRSPDRDKRERPGSSYESKLNELVASGAELAHGAAASRHHDVISLEPEAAAVCKQSSPVDHPEDIRSSFEKPEISPTRSTLSAAPVPTPCTSAEDSHVEKSACIVPGTSSSAPSVVSLSQTSSEQSQSGEIRRTSSLKEATLTRTEYTEKRKGILKRNTSLSKQDLAEAAGSSSFPVVDPQLAKILLQRKKVVGDASEAIQEAERKEDAGSVLRRSKPLSAAEEIEETLRYSQQQAAQKGLDPEESEGLRRVTVAERIYSMQTKIEEEKYAALTPKSRSGLSTPRSRSGLITPTSQKSFDETIHQRSLTSSSVTESSTTATHQQHQDSDHAALSGSQLMERLSEIAVASERYQERLGEITVATERYQEKLGETAVTSERYQEKLSETAVTSERYQEKPGETAVTSEKYQERRHRYQQRARNDWRHQTQPVTSDEIEAADSLESVSAFRALVRKKHSFNAFDQVRADAAKVAKQQLLAGGKKTEFPQHLAPPPKLSRRNRKLRHMTLPVTAEELKAVPEHQMLVTDPDWVKTEDFIKRDSKTDSGILSGSDADSLYQSESPRSLTLDMDLSDTDPSRMSVTDKASMFRGLEEKTKAERDKEKSASGAKRYINRKKRERSQTMPITEEEVKSASEIGDNKGSGVNSSGKTTPTSPQQPEVVNRSRSNSITEEEDREHVDDDLVKLSLTEKVKLFSQPSEAEKPPVKAEITVVRRRARKMASRFNTQPVTSEEVEKAAASTRISPLAMTMIRPPDPDILKALPLKDQRELMAQHAEMLLSQTSLRSRSGSNASSQPSSRRASVTLEEEEEEEKKDEEEEGTEKGDKKGILKDKSASAKDLHDIRSILKSEPAKAKSESEVHSILKSDVKHVIQCSLVSAREPRGILKKTKSEDASLGVSSDSVKGILKHAEDEDEELQGKPRSRSNSQPLGILKSENASLANEHFLEIKSILRAPSQESVQETPVIKSALRRSSVGSDTPTPGGGGGVLKSALKTRIRNSPDAEEGHIVSAMISEVSSEKSGRETGHDLNSNNSQRHVPETAEPRADLFDISRSTRLNSAMVSSSASSSVIVEVKTSSTTSSSTVTESTATTTQVSAGSSANRGGDGMSASEDGESSSGEILDETPRTTRLKRKSRFSDKSVKTERYRTQPPELTEASSSAAAATSTDTPVRQKYKYEGRHMTQPITPSEMREAEAATPATELTHGSGGSIADRLSKLKTSGEEEWKKRVSKKDEMLISPEVIKLRDKTGMPMPRPNSIADRLNELETSKKNWRERVEETDVKQFTVAGKLANTGATDSPLVSKLKNLPRKEESSSRGSTPLSSPVTPTKEFIAKIPLPRDIVHDPTVSVEIEKKTTVSEETEVRREPVKVEIPVMGEEMEIFFAVKSIEDIQDRVHLEVDDFNNIFIDSEMILSTVRKVRPTRKTRPRSANPLKSMSQKLEIRQEYTESFSGVAEKEFKRVKREGLAKDAGFAQAALAGLASTENFKQVELRRTDSGSSGHGQPLDPFAELMLLHVKGRRTVQTRLVEPNTRSINEGDCYILVAQDKVIVWEGRYANVIEKAKASEVANYIQQKKDLGCKRASEVSTVYQAKDFLGAGKVMWTALEGDKQCQACGPDAEDELYESSIVRCNMVYRLEGNALKPYEEYWGALPRYEMLKKNEVIIFDFGTEFYIWQGKAVSMEQRKLGLKLSKQLYEKGYDYTESPINPLSPLRSEDSGGLPLSGPKRPSWTIFGKVNQNMETILFREKFADWPDSSRLIGCKTVGPVETVTKELLELKPFDASRMIAPNTSPVTLKLEGANLGRGVKWSEDMQGFVKEQDIVTLDVTVWHVMEYEHYKLPELSHGQFHDGDTYVVRWQYMITNANLRSLKGSAARNSLTGRERCAYFFWQGNQSTINEKGASALMTVELDEERGPQVRVLQGKEPPCFLNLFGGKMIIHIGKREDPATNTQGAWRLYTVRGDYENEVYLLEIPVSIAHLRSRSSLILLNVRTGILYIWHGAKSPKHVRELCIKVVGRLKESMPLEIGLHEKANLMAIEVEEGEEKREIWSALDGRDRSIYHSLLTDPRPYTHTVRLFHMSSVNLVFEVHEQLNPSRVPDLTTAFPFLQSDLYKAAQPALFLLDNDHEVYLWQGWWPVGSHDTENVQTGSALARFNLDRRLAMETTLHYCREKSSSRPAKAYLVCAGLEPVCFTTLFPYWEEDTIVKDIAVQEGKSLGYMEPISDILHRLTETRYSLAELQERPLPEGVDPLRLESYLDDAEFEEILEMNRDEFYAQPHWKQIDMKKHVGLF